MPRPAKGARLWFDKNAKLWFIRDGSLKRGTGCSLEERAGAEEKLKFYIAKKYEPPKDRRAAGLLVADILTYYARNVAPGQKSDASSYAIERLVEWWGPRAVSEVKTSTCKAYVEHRMSQPIRQAIKAKIPKMTSQETARRELTVLRAAINAWHAETPFDALPVVTLPKQSPPRNRWLTRTEVARLLHATRKLEDKDAGRALRRFIIVSIYTATRSGAVRRLGWLPNTLGGHIDFDAGVIHRRGEDDEETRKRRPPARIPDRIAGNLRRWRSEDMRQTNDHDPIPFVIHFRGSPVASQRRSWAAACKIAGLGNEVTPHILKHTAITWMMRSGIDPWDVSGYAGTSLKMIEEVYGHHHPEFQGDVANRIGKRT